MLAIIFYCYCRVWFSSHFVRRRVFPFITESLCDRKPPVSVPDFEVYTRPVRNRSRSPPPKPRDEGPAAGLADFACEYLHGEVVDEALPSGRPLQEIVHLPLERGPGSAVFFAQVPVLPGRSRPLGGHQSSRVRRHTCSNRQTRRMRPHFRQTSLSPSHNNSVDGDDVSIS